MKEEVDDSTKNKLIEEFIDIVEAAYITNSGKDFDKVWEQSSQETRTVVERVIIHMMAKEAVSSAALANAKYTVQLAYAGALQRGTNAGAKTGDAYSIAPTLGDDGKLVGGAIMTAEDYYAEIARIEASYQE